MDVSARDVACQTFLVCATNNNWKFTLLLMTAVASACAKTDSLLEQIQLFPAASQPPLTPQKLTIITIKWCSFEYCCHKDQSLAQPCSVINTDATYTSACKLAQCSGWLLWAVSAQQPYLCANHGVQNQHKRPWRLISLFTWVQIHFAIYG